MYISTPTLGTSTPGYVLLDLDHTEPTALDQMRAHGHEPCVVLQTSPGHLQAWVHVSVAPLETAVATGIGRQLARAYGGDLASCDWRHLGRLAGFTNQKPQRQFNGQAPWVKLLHTRLGLATCAAALLEQAGNDTVGDLASATLSLHGSMIFQA